MHSPFVRHTSLTYRTHNFPPPAPLPKNAKHREYFPGCFPPSPVSPHTALGHAQHHVLLCHASLCICLHCIHCFFPLFSPVDYETDAAAAQFDYGVDDPSLLPEQPGKPPPLITRYRLFRSTACIRVVQHVTVLINPILMHSLSLLLHLLIPYLQS